MRPIAKNMPDFATLHAEETPAPAPGVLVSAYFSQPYGYAVRRERGTRDWLITYTVAGQGRYQQGSSALYCQQGDVVLLPPNIIHDYATASIDTPWGFYWAHFIPRPYWLPWLALPESQDGLRLYAAKDAETRQRIEQAFRRLVSDSQEKGPYRDALAQNALEEAFILIAMERSLQSSSANDPRVNLVQQYLEQHFHQPIQMALLARKVALSPWRLAHLYKEATGQSMMEYLTRLRLREAARLLALTSRSVAEIGRDVGFESSNHFSRLFKKYYGISPRLYRATVNP
jgi:AraC family transcriptional regulator of arabinose operon